MQNWSAPKLFLVGIGALLSLAGCGGVTDDRPAKWSFISPAIIVPSCATASCHSAIAERGGVDLHDRVMGYKHLHDRNFATPAVVGMPETAPLVFLLRAQGTRRMPPDFPLPLEDIELIQKWIAAGAPNN